MKRLFRGALVLFAEWTIKALNFLDHLIENRKAIRRTLVVWAAGLITIVTYDILTVVKKMDEVTTPVVSFYLGVTALLTAVIGFYQWSRERDQQSDSSEVREASGDPAGPGGRSGRTDLPPR
jgi:hypothetical protein